MNKYFLFLILFIFVNCDRGLEIYAVKGTVRSLDTLAQKAIIAHDTIPELMMPMVMPFFVRNLHELNKIKKGDSVHFELVWGESIPYSRNFKIVGKGFMPEVDDFFIDEFSEKNIGDVLDDVSLLNMDSSNIYLSDSDGNYRFISYVFTRCPMPNLCPAIVLKNAALANKFPDINFIMVSFDYKYDTPSILTGYYGPLVEDLENWDVWSSTGRIDNIYKLIKQSGGNFWGVDRNKIGHTLSSVLIGPERQILGRWKGEDWEVKKVENAISILVE